MKNSNTIICRRIYFLFDITSQLLLTIALMLINKFLFCLFLAYIIRVLREFQSTHIMKRQFVIKITYQKMDFKIYSESSSSYYLNSYQLLSYSIAEILNIVPLFHFTLTQLALVY